MIYRVLRFVYSSSLTRDHPILLACFSTTISRVCVQPCCLTSCRLVLLDRSYHSSVLLACYFTLIVDFIQNPELVSVLWYSATTYWLLHSYFYVGFMLNYCPTIDCPILLSGYSTITFTRSCIGLLSDQQSLYSTCCLLYSRFHALLEEQ